MIKNEVREAIEHKVMALVTAKAFEPKPERKVKQRGRIKGQSDYVTRSDVAEALGYNSTDPLVAGVIAKVVEQMTEYESRRGAGILKIPAPAVPVADAAE